MGERAGVAEIIGRHKILFSVIAVCLFLIELEIFAFAAMKAGRKSYLQVLDRDGIVIHETDGKNLSEFNKYYFEKTFGPLENYQVRLVNKETPFPFRAWLTAAVGIPVGAVLLLSFVVKAFKALVYGEDKRPVDERTPTEKAASFQGILRGFNRLNIFIMGFLVLMAVLAYWTIPNLLTYLGRVGIETLSRYKWFFIIAALVLLGVVLWIIYLRYLLAKKSIECRFEVDRQRLQLEFQQRRLSSGRLEYRPEPPGNDPAVDADAEKGARFPDGERGGFSPGRRRTPGQFS